jgi:transcriptional regulator with XRE-family HTH domain
MGSSLVITPAQIRAARSLINLSQSELSEVTGVSQTSLSAIEREGKAPRGKTLEVIREALESKGVEFTQGEGVRLSDKVFNFKIMDGPDRLNLYIKDIIDTLKVHGGEYLGFLDQEEHYTTKYRKMYYWYCNQLIKNSISERVIVPANAKKLYAPASTSQYRYFTEDAFGHISTSIYGNKLVIYEKERALVIENKAVADAFRKRFEIHWKQSQPVPSSVPRIFDEDKKVWGKTNI